MSYDADALRAFFNAYGEREWDRLDKTLPGRVKLAVHRKVLSEHVRPGMRVLDVGSGPGRFAIEIARMGATVTLVDLSDVQLDLARARIVEQGESERVDGFHRLDVLDLSTLVLTNPTSNEFHRPMALFTSRGLRDALTRGGTRGGADRHVGRIRAGVLADSSAVGKLARSGGADRARGGDVRSAGASRRGRTSDRRG